MSLREKHLILSLVCFVTLLVTLAPIATGSALWYTYVPIISTVEDAWYGEHDGDGYRDDIVIVTYTVIQDFSYYDKYYGYRLSLCVGLELPSGREYWYRIDFLVYKSSFHFALIYYDHATEKGYYGAHVYGYNARSTAILQHSLYFDPPGKGSGANPTVGFVTW